MWMSSKTRLMSSGLAIIVALLWNVITVIFKKVNIIFYTFICSINGNVYVLQNFMYIIYFTVIVFFHLKYINCVSLKCINKKETKKVLCISNNSLWRLEYGPGGIFLVSNPHQKPCIKLWNYSCEKVLNIY